MRNIALFYVTFPNKKSALKISNKLLHDGLIACSNILSPHLSIYMWQGKDVTEKEVGVLYKLAPKNKKKFARELHNIHPYVLPCIIELNVKSINKTFARWVNQAKKI